MSNSALESTETETDYFKIPAVSNSGLTALKYEIYGRELPDLTEAFFFGSLVDAMLTERHRISFLAKTYDGQKVDFKIWARAHRCYLAIKNDQKAWPFIRNAETQKVSIKDRLIKHNGVEFFLRCKCKWDFFGHISGDIKTTAATSQKQFEDVCLRLDYYRSRAWYMDLEGTNMDVIIGVSKVNFKVFFVRIQRGDEKYQIGKEQYEELAFKWWVLKEPNAENLK